MQTGEPGRGEFSVVVGRIGGHAFRGEDDVGELLEGHGVVAAAVVAGSNLVLVHRRAGIVDVCVGVVVARSPGTRVLQTETSKLGFPKLILNAKKLLFGSDSGSRKKLKRRTLKSKSFDASISAQPSRKVSGSYWLVATSQ